MAIAWRPSGSIGETNYYKKWRNVEQFLWIKRNVSKALLIKNSQQINKITTIVNKNRKWLIKLLFVNVLEGRKKILASEWENFKCNLTKWACNYKRELSLEMNWMSYKHK